MAKTRSSISNGFLQYKPTERPDIYQVGINTWTSIISVHLKPTHLLSSEQAEGIIANFAGLLNGTLSGDPNPALTLQFLLMKYPSSFADLIRRYDEKAASLAAQGRPDASNIAWVWQQYLSNIFSYDIHQRKGGIAITVRPIKSLIKKNTDVLGQTEAFSLLDDTASRVMAVTRELNWGGERLSDDSLTEFLTFWAMGDSRRPRQHEAKLFAWEV